MASQPLRIGLLWHSLASGNLGVDALTAANLAMLRSVAEQRARSIEPVVIGMADNRPPNRPDEPSRSYPINRRSLLSPRGFWQVADSVDCFVDIGAGDSFAQIYGPKRFAFLWLTKVMALLRGKPLLLAPQTIGLFSSQSYRTAARPVLERATAVVVRDFESSAAARDMAPTARIVESVDVAFNLPFASRASERGSARARIGINVSGLLFHQALSGRNRFGLSYDYAAAMRDLIRHLCAQPDVEVLLLTHATSTDDPTDDDGWICDQLAREFPAATRVPDFADSSAAKSFISGLDFLFAARMHACIAALSSGTPVLPIAYSRKFSGLFGSLGYDGWLPVDGLTTQEATHALIRAVDRRADLAPLVDRALERVEPRLDAYRDELHRLFERCAA